jgi:hypothetical protein
MGGSSAIAIALSWAFARHGMKHSLRCVLGGDAGVPNQASGDHPKQHPGTIARGPSAAQFVVLFQPPPGILANADVKTRGALAP